MIYKVISVALPALGSAILLISCGGRYAAEQEQKNILTMRGDSITRFESQDGRLTARFFTPLMEQYEYAPEPYDEYRYGVEMINYDSLGAVSSTFRADYAIFFRKLQLWEAKGDVVITNGKQDRLETNQLFWNRLTKRVYSNVDSDFFMSGDVLHGTSFESNEDLTDWQVRNANGGIHVNVEPTRDSTAVAQDSLPSGMAVTAHSKALEAPADGAASESRAALTDGSELTDEGTPSANDPKTE